MSEPRGMKANKALRQSMRDMGLDAVLEDADREELEDAHNAIAALRAENQRLTDERDRFEHEIRRRIWLMHGTRVKHNLYGDDGLMDCNTCLRSYRTATLEQVYRWEMLDAALQPERGEG